MLGYTHTHTCRDTDLKFSVDVFICTRGQIHKKWNGIGCCAVQGHTILVGPQRWTDDFFRLFFTWVQCYFHWFFNALLDVKWPKIMAATIYLFFIFCWMHDFCFSIWVPNFKCFTLYNVSAHLALYLEIVLKEKDNWSLWPNYWHFHDIMPKMLISLTNFKIPWLALLNYFPGYSWLMITLF